MLLDIVIIVLRETLEASVLIGVLLSVSRHTDINLLWIFPAMILGTAAALFYALSLGEISEWFDYAGQEVINAGMQYIIYALLGCIVCLLFSLDKQKRKYLKGLMVASVAMAMVREGSELFVFYTAFLSQPGSTLQAATSGFIGLSVGVSAGVIGYYALVTQKPFVAKAFQAVLLVLIGTGMAMQATQLLIQVDWISVNEPVWDSSWLVAEASATGQVLYAVFGYEATPSMIEIILYFISMAMILGSVMLLNFFTKNRNNEVKP